MEVAERQGGDDGSLEVGKIGMSNLTSERFLGGRGIAVDPREIEARLGDLWGPAAEQVGGPDIDQPAVTRIVLANLVVAGAIDDDDHIDDVLDPVVARFPCRTLVLRRSHDDERRIESEISALCHLPAPGRPQVCSERIELRAGPRARDLLPGAVRPLLEPDLPFVLWWNGDPREESALFEALVEESSRSLLSIDDAEGDGEALAAGLANEINPFGHDIAWFGATPWRGLIAQFFECPTRRSALEHINSVEIRGVSASSGRPTRVAVWLAAWLAGQLDWKPRSVERSSDRLIARFDKPASDHRDARSVVLSLSNTTDSAAETSRVLSVGFDALRPGRAEERYFLSRPSAASADISIETTGGDRDHLPGRVLAPELDTARRLAAALESSRDDPPFRRALPIALWLLGEHSAASAKAPGSR